MAATLLTSVALLLPVAASGGGSGLRSARLPILGIVPHTGASHAAAARNASGADDLFLQESSCARSSYPYPCWTMPRSTAYAIYWVPSGYSVDPSYESLIDRYFRDVAAASGSATNVFSVLTQYYDSVASVGYSSTFGGSYVDTTPFPKSACSDGVDRVCLTDDQIRAELENVLGEMGWHAGKTSMFFLMTPDGVGSCMDNVTGLCTTTAYCAYHSTFVDTSHRRIVYANEPYAATLVDVNGHRGCTDGTSPNGSDADATLSTISHEQSEMATDPAGDAWRNNSGREIGDLCVWQFGTPLGGTVGTDAYNQVINGHRYWLQEEFSNDGSTCLQHYTPAVAPSSFSAPVVSGTAAEGQLLSVTNGAWQNAPSGYAYRWQRCAAPTGCEDIAAAVDSTYRLVAADAGHAVRVEVAAQNVAGSSTFVRSAPTAPVVPVPTLTAQPLLSGKAVVGRKLHLTTGWWNSSVAVTYTWRRCDGSACRSIPRATTAFYRLKPSDAGLTIEARVSGRNEAGTTASAADRSKPVRSGPGA